MSFDKSGLTAAGTWLGLKLGQRRIRPQCRTGGRRTGAQEVVDHSFRQPRTCRFTIALPIGGQGKRYCFPGRATGTNDAFTASIQSSHP